MIKIIQKDMGREMIYTIDIYQMDKIELSIGII